MLAKSRLQLLWAGRAEEALSHLDRAQPSEQNRNFGQLNWTDARIAVLEALKRTDEAQALRLAFFQVYLSLSHLRAYLHQLPDFEDFEAEQRALDHVGGYANFHAALSFLVEWPAHERAAQLVLSRNKEIDGDRYELLDPAASQLKENIRWPRFCSGARSSKSRCARPAPHATSTPRGMSVRSIV